MNLDFLFGAAFSVLFFIFYAIYINLLRNERWIFKAGWILGLSIGIIVGVFTAVKFNLSF